MIASASRELVDSMSDIVWAINPQKDHLSDLTQRMRLFASDIFTGSDIKFRFDAPGADQDVRIGANMRREVFLIFKESVNNLVRHSGCTEAEIEFRVEDDWLALRVSDNGAGFDASRQSDGHGLMSMRDRARDTGGDFEVLSGNGKGTTVNLKLPSRRRPRRLANHTYLGSDTKPAVLLYTPEDTFGAQRLIRIAKTIKVAIVEDRREIREGLTMLMAAPTVLFARQYRSVEERWIK